MAVFLKNFGPLKIFLVIWITKLLVQRNFQAITKSGLLGQILSKSNLLFFKGKWSDLLQEKDDFFAKVKFLSQNLSNSCHTERKFRRPDVKFRKCP